MPIHPSNGLAGRSTVNDQLDASKVRAYLEGLRDGPPVKLANVETRLTTVEARLSNQNLDPVERLLLTQERLNLLAQFVAVKRAEETLDDFVETCARYSERNGISYEAWREFGVRADVLTRAGLRANKAGRPAGPAPKVGEPPQRDRVVIDYLRSHDGQIVVGHGMSAPRAIHECGLLRDVKEDTLSSWIHSAQKRGTIAVTRDRVGGKQKITGIVLPTEVPS